MKNTRNLILSFLYLLCLYLSVKLLPLSDWFPLPWASALIRSLLLFLLSALAIYEARKYRPYSSEKRIHPLFFLPFWIVCSSNLLYGGMMLNVDPSIDWPIFLTSAVELVVSVLLEETLFRFLLQEALLVWLEKRKQGKIFSLFLCAFCFSLMHLINLLGNTWDGVLIQLGYTFFLGIVLSFIALYSNRTSLPFLAHASFNFLNSLLFSSLYTLDAMTWQYVVLSSLLGIIFLLYLLILYLIRIRKKEKNDVS